MGIDVLDLKFRFEKAFNISIADKEVVFLIMTPGHIHDLIWQRLQGIHPACPTGPLEISEKVRQALLQLPGVRIRSRRIFRPTFDRIIPQERRFGHWKELSERLGCPLPPLEDDRGFLTFPTECQTPDALANWIWKHYADRYPNVREEFNTQPPRGADRWTRESVWEMVQHTIVDCLGVELKDVTSDTRMIEELGME